MNGLPTRGFGHAQRLDFDVPVRAACGAWPRQRIGDEALKFRLGSYGTTANTMPWFWPLLTRDLAPGHTAELSKQLHCGPAMDCS